MSESSAPLDTVATTISIRKLGHRFGERPVFHGVDLEVRSGEIAVVCGANGSGKSTFLKIVAGMLTPTAGTVTFRHLGVDLDPLRRRGLLGYVAPDLTLYRELTGVENLSFFARLRGLEPTHELLRSSLDQVGLLGRGSDLVSGYSSGMRQRLKYAFALLGHPPILLLDEPTANLDLSGIDMVERVIAARRSYPGGLVLIATNEPSEEAWGDIRVRL